MTKKDLENEMTEAWFQSRGVYACMDVAIKYADQETERLKAELNELKEKHKRDVIEAYEIAYNHVGDVMMGFKKITGEQYYKQKFESNGK